MVYKNLNLRCKTIEGRKETGHEIQCNSIIAFPLLYKFMFIFVQTCSKWFELQDQCKNLLWVTCTDVDWWGHHSSKTKVVSLVTRALTIFF